MAKKASDNLKYYHNPNGPTIGTVSRRVIEQDGLTFKDIDGTGEVTPVNDWRLSPAERAAAYVKTLTVDEKIAQLFISDWRMGPACPAAGHTVVPDESGVLDDADFNGKTIFGEQHLPGTTTLIKEWFNRHLILRASPSPPTWPTGSTSCTPWPKSASTLFRCRRPPTPATRTARWSLA